jgi:Terminase large subunit, T4likevirus-type, N-terminal
VGAATDLAMALDRVAFARALGMEKPDPWQRALLRSAGGERVLLNIARQLGKSTTTAILALHRALYHPGSLILILAPAERQARETFAKIAAFYKTLGHAPAPDSDRKLGLELTNGSRIEALPGTQKTVRGFSGVSLLIVDEAARVLDDLYFAIRPMLAVSGGSLLMLSTPAGKRGVFFEEWTNGGPSWERYEVRAEECPRISPQFLAEERRTLPSWVYRQEYECSFEETDDQVFSIDLIDGAVSADVAPLFGGDAA